jgi:hypothetical protein
MTRFKIVHDFKSNGQASALFSGSNCGRPCSTRVEKLEPGGKQSAGQFTIIGLAIALVLPYGIL